MSRQPQPREDRAVLLIHGVSRFSEARTRKAVERAAADWLQKGTTVHFFNWDRLAGSPRSFLRVLRRWLEETGLGLLVAARIGLKAEPSGQDGLAVELFNEKETNFLESADQICLWWSVCLIPFVLLCLPFLALDRSLFWILMGSFVATHIFTAMVALARPGVRTISVVRRHVLVMLWPMVHLMSFCGILELIVGLGIFLVIHGMANVTGDESGLQNVLVSITAFLVLAMIISFFTMPAFKIFGDLFRWIGLPGYRAGLRQALDAELRRLARRRPRELWIIAHSLGSVLAIDALIRPGLRLGEFDRVMLVTFGSPLRRFFVRWFPGLFPTPDEVASIVTSRTKIFRWINIYRPFDPIGTRLSRGGDYPVDLSTKQWKFLFGLLPAHIGYWGDPVVLSALLRGVDVAERRQGSTRQALAQGRRPRTDKFERGLEPWERLADVALGPEQRQFAGRCFIWGWFVGLCLMIIGVGTYLTGEFSFMAFLTIPLLVASVTLFWFFISSTLSWFGIHVSVLDVWVKTLFCLEIDEGCFEGESPVGEK